MRNVLDDAGNFDTVMTHLVNLRNEVREPLEEPRLPMWIDNWNRLGLIEASYDVYDADPTAYDWVDDRPEVVRMSKNPDINRLDPDKGLILKTAFGTRFYKAVKDPE